MALRFRLVAVLVTLGVAAAACSDRDRQELTPADRTESADTCERFPSFCDSQTGDFLFQVGRALDGAGSYRLAVTQTNLVLPRWGGSDGGTVGVDLKADIAVADLPRTGDGRYTVVLRSGETYFQRQTCPTWARIQDGGEVLAPFIITSEDMAHSKLLDVLPSPSASSSVVSLDLEGLGVVTMEVEKSTWRPIRVTSGTLTNNGKSLEWSFSSWGEKVTAPDVSTNRSSGPGGNPC